MVGHLVKGTYIEVNCTILTIFSYYLKIFKIKFKKNQTHRAFSFCAIQRCRTKWTDDFFPTIQMNPSERTFQSLLWAQNTVGCSKNVKEVKCPSHLSTLLSAGGEERKTGGSQRMGMEVDWEKCLKKGVNRAQAITVTEMRSFWVELAFAVWGESWQVESPKEQKCKAGLTEQWASLRCLKCFCLVHVGKATLVFYP